MCFLYFQKYNMFLAQIGCAAIGVVAFSIFGPGWLARSVALAASIAFMVIARANHPPGTYLSSFFSEIRILFSNMNRVTYMNNQLKKKKNRT